MVSSGVALSYPWADRLTIKSVALFQQPVMGQPRVLTAGITDANAEPDPFRARVVWTGASLSVRRFRLFVCKSRSQGVLPQPTNLS